MLRALARKAGSFRRHPAFVKLWFLPAWLLLGVSRALILTASFKRLAPRLGIHTGAEPWVPLLDDDQESRAREIGRVVRLAARYTPWTSNCFPQAVTARILLGLYSIPYALHFGLIRESEAGGLKAHAWLSAGRVHVTGGRSFGRFTVVGTFVAPNLTQSTKSS